LNRRPQVDQVAAVVRCEVAPDAGLVADQVDAEALALLAADRPGPPLGTVTPSTRQEVFRHGLRPACQHPLDCEDISHHSTFR
jgi:hypothetical protein